MAGAFDPAYEDLPRVIPIFPLSGVLLLPGGRLPLNIFEPRYLNMTLAALGGARTIGMIQPLAAEAGGEAPPVYATGCAGRIVSFAETEDGRFLITLVGTCRFDIAEELPLRDGYRRVRAEYGRFHADLDEPEGEIDRARLLAALRAYLRHNGISANWEAIEDTADDRLVTSLAMMCPFAPSEKQALLEAPDLAERAAVLTALLEMALAEPGGAGKANH